jgi:hypothetical protein
MEAETSHIQTLTRVDFRRPSFSDCGRDFHAPRQQLGTVACLGLDRLPCGCQLLPFNPGNGSARNTFRTHCLPSLPPRSESLFSARGNHGRLGGATLRSGQNAGITKRESKRRVPATQKFPRSSRICWRCRSGEMNLSLAKFKSAFNINTIRRGCVTCYMDDIQTARRFGEGQGSKYSYFELTEKRTTSPST